MFSITLLVTVAMVACCYGYGLGPPLSSCQDMFPTGHEAVAQTDATPFAFTLNATTYQPGETIEGTYMIYFIIYMYTSISNLHMNLTVTLDWTAKQSVL